MIDQLPFTKHTKVPRVLYITWKGFFWCTRKTSFQSAGPLQASSFVPTLNPLQEWNMILIDSEIAGTKKLCLALFFPDVKLKAGMSYSQCNSDCCICTRKSNLQNVFVGSEYSFVPLTFASSEPLATIIDLPFLLAVTW